MDDASEHIPELRKLVPAGSPPADCRSEPSRPGCLHATNVTRRARRNRSRRGSASTEVKAEAPRSRGRAIDTIVTAIALPLASAARN